MKGPKAAITPRRAPWRPSPRRSTSGGTQVRCHHLAEVALAVFAIGGHQCPPDELQELVRRTQVGAIGEVDHLSERTGRVLAPTVKRMQAGDRAVSEVREHVVEARLVLAVEQVHQTRRAAFPLAPGLERKVFRIVPELFM